jgi:hypothetical protein|nr:MAG TPA: hypothetical protein [Caudoviricetes sp.]
MALLSDKIIHKSRKEALCGVCAVVMPKGTHSGLQNGLTKMLVATA